MRVVVLAALVVACGSPQPVNQSEPPKPSPAVPTCGEVGIILRGVVEGSDEKAGPAKEKTITEACERDRWPQAVISCVAATPNADDCLKQLAPAQHKAYDERMAAWSKQYGTATTTEEEPQPQASCADALHAIELFDPPITETSPEREWETAARTRTLSGMCDTDQWPDEMLACLRDAQTQPATGTCATNLDPKVHARLVVLRDLAKSIEVKRQTPAKLDCKQVVEHHYGDARWKDQLKDKKPAERKKLIADARKRMLDACFNEAWNEATRACVLADGDDLACFGFSRFGYTAAGLAAIGIPECDDYMRVIQAYQSCTKVTQQSRDAVRQAFDAASKNWASVPDDVKPALADACKAGADAIKQTLTSMGC